MKSWGRYERVESDCAGWTAVECTSVIHYALPSTIEIVSESCNSRVLPPWFSFCDLYEFTVSFERRTSRCSAKVISLFSIYTNEFCIDEAGIQRKSRIAFHGACLSWKRTIVLGFLDIANALIVKEVTAICPESGSITFFDDSRQHQNRCGKDI